MTSGQRIMNLRPKRNVPTAFPTPTPPVPLLPLFAAITMEPSPPLSDSNVVSNPTPQLDPEDQRYIECPYRSEAHTCLLIDNTLGWGFGLPLETCNKCWKNNPDSPQSQALRTTITADVITEMKKPHMLAKTPKNVAVPLTLNHMTIAERKAAEPLLKQAGLGKINWRKAKPTWEQAQSMLKSVASRSWRGKRTEAGLKRQRHISCFGIDEDGLYIQSPCPDLLTSRDGQHHFCNSCGCGDKRIAWLDEQAQDPSGTYTKLDYPYLECPRQRPGFSNALPTTQDAS